MNGTDEDDREFQEQVRIAERAMHRYRHALRALATGQTVEEAREEMAREGRPGSQRPGSRENG